MLVSHLNYVEQVLLARSQVASNAGHPNLRGWPREWFIKEFLADHLPSSLEMGQGEIISANSAPKPSPGEYRPQNDLIIYQRDFPKISFSPSDGAYLIEGVVATLEIKSKLSKTELKRACKASQANKSLISQIGTRLGLRVDNHVWEPSHIISYVVAYDGPVNFSTVAGWFPKLVTEFEVEPELLVDMVVILGKGVAWRMNAFPALDRIPNACAGDSWAFIQQAEKNLYALFAHMLTIGKTSSSPPKVSSYISHVSNSDIRTI